MATNIFLTLGTYYQVEGKKSIQVKVITLNQTIQGIHHYKNYTKLFREDSTFR